MKMEDFIGKPAEGHVYKGISKEDKEDCTMGMKKIGYSYDFIIEWEKLKKRLENMSVAEQHSECKDLLNTINTHLNHYKINGVPRVSIAKQDIENTIAELEKKNPDLRRLSSSEQKSGNSERAVSNTENRTPKGKNYLMPEFEDRLNEIENKIQSEVEQWKSGKNKIGCACFVEMLYNKKYLINGNNNRQRCIHFALNRYGINIETQMTTGKDLNRKKHERYFKKCFG